MLHKIYSPAPPAAQIAKTQSFALPFDELTVRLSLTVLIPQSGDERTALSEAPHHMVQGEVEGRQPATNLDQVSLEMRFRSKQRQE